jgi:cyclic pyranopterin phosphate synthase
MTTAGGLPHLDEHGAARMVDVTAKAVTTRSATARCRVTVSTEVAGLLHDGLLPKGDALAVARIAAIQAAKRTSELIPLCHPIAIHGVDVDIAVVDAAAGAHVEILVTVRTADRTGVEMEALTAAAVGGLSIIDMVKGRDRSAAIGEVVLLEKLGGRSGHWTRVQEHA